MPLARGPHDLVCSARDCQLPAIHAVQWRNPRIHTGRVKTWLACDEHKDYLVTYLSYRHFPTTVRPLSEVLAEDAPDRNTSM